MGWLPRGKKISKISLFVFAQLTNVTDGRMNRQTPGDGNSRAMHSIARQKSYTAFSLKRGDRLVAVNEKQVRGLTWAVNDPHYYRRSMQGRMLHFEAQPCLYCFCARCDA